MNIQFIGVTKTTNITVLSNSILQGIKGGQKTIFLKHKETFPKWVECIYETVKQIK